MVHVMIGIFGSAFNPPTRGHMDVILRALTKCDEVWLTPSIAHAFGKDMLPFETRLAMTQGFARDIGGTCKGIQVCDVEQEIWDGENPVYTIDVLSALQDRHPDKEFAFLCGPDNASEFYRFKGAEEIIARWTVLAAEDRTKIRSTLVRMTCAARRNIHTMVTPNVERFIIREGLYGR